VEEILTSPTVPVVSNPFINQLITRELFTIILDAIQESTTMPREVIPTQLLTRREMTFSPEVKTILPKDLEEK
jgi:hypothetical protein